ncbi:hypothetical protein DRE_00164 [Drechslerella stenobrocha 248]|uniref:Developmental regulatory protein wetA n=1 Tax=Drechslerella stenobrocha 248 TaxID=1043628 RepID=W7HZB0_9PEZI|nr:hypothetical protein DRE_00164 [Drechslerella stenobrocha 248]
MWKPAEESKDAYASENGDRTESWWTKDSAVPGEQMVCLLGKYMQTGPEGKEASVEDRSLSFRTGLEHPHSIGSSIPPQVPGIEITMMGDARCWPRQDALETSGPPDGLDGGSDVDGLGFFRDNVYVAGDDCGHGEGGERTAEGQGSRSSTCSFDRDGEQDGGGELVDRTLLSRLVDKPGQLQSSASSRAGSLVKPGRPHKPGSPSPPPVNIISSSSSSSSSSSPSSPSQTQLQLQLQPRPAPTSAPYIPGKAYPASARLTARRSLSAVQQYRLLDERQAKRAPLWRRRVNYTSSLPDSEEMLATARTQAYHLSSPTPMAESLRYQAPPEASYFLHREQTATDHGDLFPLSPPLSSARSSFLCPNNNVAPHLNGNYNLSTESLPSNVEPNAINLLSRPHSMPQLQEQMENPFEDGGAMMKPQPSLSAYSSFNAPCPITESLELDPAEDSSSSAQGSSPQAWWSQNANLDLAQDGSALIYPATSAPAAAASAFTSLPNMSPKRRFNQTPSSDNLHSQLLLLQHQQQQQQQPPPPQQQQQPRSPMLEPDRLYAFMNGQQPHSAMPSPPGSPGYYFGPPITSDGFCSPPNPNGVSFIDPFHNSAAHHPAHQHSAFNTFPRRTPLSKSMLGYDTPVQSTPPIPIRTVPSHSGHSTGVSRSSYLRKTGSLGRSARMPSMGKGDPREVSFVNFTPHDATKILSGVAPSGSSKTKARREREAQEKRRKLSEAAAAAVLAAGGDPSTIENIDF